MFRYLTRIAGPALAVALVLSACSTGDEDAAPAASVADVSVPGEASAESQTLKIDVEQSITLTSPVFHDKRRISKNYSCTRLSANDPNISPPLAWEGVSEEARASR
jgi:phosphatidylethanolamine-binding protein (PEBP) family uncharacterized protein